MEFRTAIECLLECWRLTPPPRTEAPNHDVITSPTFTTPPNALATAWPTKPQRRPRFLRPPHDGAPRLIATYVPITRNTIQCQPTTSVSPPGSSPPSSSLSINIKNQSIHIPKKDLISFPSSPTCTAIASRLPTQIQRRFKDLSDVGQNDETTSSGNGITRSPSVVAARGTSPLWPKTYFCTAAGARWLRRSLESRGKTGHVIRADRGRPEGYSAEHVLHELLTTELLLDVWECSQAGTGFQLLQTERRTIPSESEFALEIRARRTGIEPDAWFVYRQEGKGIMCCCCETDVGTMSKNQLKAKFGRYEHWVTSARGKRFLMELYRSHGAQNPRPTFRLLTIACDRNRTRDNKRLDLIYDAVASFPAISSCFLALTTSMVAERPNLQILLS